MHFSIAAMLSSLAFLTPSYARLVGMRAPQTIQIGQPVPVSLLTENQLSSFFDAAVVFGLDCGSPGQPMGPSAIGTIVGSKYLGDMRGVQGPIESSIFIPDDNWCRRGSHVLSASTFSLMGARASPIINTWNVSITVGDFTSAETIDQRGVPSWACHA